ncbi:MAG: thiamine diphosphokinase [Oscillibacter sp.]
MVNYQQDKRGNLLMNRCFIFAAGSYYGLRLRPVAGDFVIAADAGYRVCQAEDIVPDLLLGDFDSMEQPTDFANVCRVPVEKDDTDTMLAVKTGLEQGCTEFFLYGCTGGKRLDHTLANLQALLYLRRHGARGWLYDDDFIWTAVENESLTVRREVEWGLFSAFCMGDSATGIDEEGFQYPLRDATMTPDLPLGVSNHILEPEARITVRHGALAVGWELPERCI